MIKGLIATLMISMGVATSATPSFNNNESKPPLLLNNTISGTTNFSLTTTFTTESSGRVNDPETESYYIRTMKREWTGYNNALNVLAHSYTQTDYTTLDNINYAFIPGTSLENKYSTILYTLQITPYKYLEDATTTLRLQTNIYTAYSDYTLRLNYDLISSTDDDWATYIDMSNYTTAFNNYNVFNELKSPNNGYTYNEKTKYQDIEITTTSNQEGYEYEEEIEIVYDQTNYVYVLITPQYQVATARITTKFAAGDTETAWAYTIVSRGPKIEGSMIIPAQNVEVVDIPGLMFEVLTMPFAFISQAFNLTLFPGTPYQLNLSNLFLSIIGVLVFIFIIKLLVKSKFGG